MDYIPARPDHACKASLAACEYWADFDFASKKGGSCTEEHSQTTVCRGAISSQGPNNLLNTRPKRQHGTWTGTVPAITTFTLAHISVPICVHGRLQKQPAASSIDGHESPHQQNRRKRKGVSSVHQALKQNTIPSRSNMHATEMISDYRTYARAPTMALILRNGHPPRATGDVSTALAARHTHPKSRHYTRERRFVKGTIQTCIHGAPKPELCAYTSSLHRTIALEGSSWALYTPLIYHHVPGNGQGLLVGRHGPSRR